MPEGSFVTILWTLRGAGVDFIVVGGVAATLYGSPGQTFDIDLVHSQEPDNIGRLLGALQNLDAIYRIQPERRLRPTASHLASPGHQNLLTRYGPMDLLGTIGRALRYSDLLPRSVTMKVGEDLTVRVIDLETLIAIKEELGTEKDRAMLPILRRTLEERKKLGYTPQQ
jgi:predicted nucleotidyltransferase